MECLAQRHPRGLGDADHSLGESPLLALANMPPLLIGLKRGSDLRSESRQTSIAGKHTESLGPTLNIQYVQ